LPVDRLVGSAFPIGGRSLSRRSGAMWTLLTEIPAWLSVLTGVAGVVVSAMNIGRTRWATVLLVGFLAETLSMAFSRLALVVVRQRLTTVATLGAAFFLASLIGLAGRVAVVAGVTGLLSELRTRAQQQRSSETSAL